MSDSAKKGYRLIFIAGIFWGTTGTGIHFLAIQGLSDMQVAFYLQLFALLFIFPIALARCGIEAFKIPFKLFAILFVTGLFSEALFDVFYANAVEGLGIAVSGVMLYISPLYVMLISRVLFKEKFTLIKIFAFILTLLGCFLTVTGGSLQSVRLGMTGIVFGLLAAFCYGLITISDKYTAEKAKPEMITFYILLSGFIAIVLISRSWSFPASVFAPKNFLIGAAAGLSSTLIPYLFFAKGLACDIEASKTPIFASVEIVISAILGIVLFGEPIGIVNILGIAIVLSSIVLLSREK